ncbi:MAG: hypothetical protein AAFR99_11190 [Cyanobacteria bacterium J06629_9]
MGKQSSLGTGYPQRSSCCFEQLETGFEQFLRIGGAESATLNREIEKWREN